MNKQDIIVVMAETANISKNAAERALNAFTESVTHALSQGQDVSLLGFGSFTTADRSARTGRNPQTGEPMQIPAARVARFKVGKKLKDAVNR